MLVRIDSAAPEPLFEQLAAQGRTAVAAGELEVGTRLPSARDLAGSLAVNLHTVLRAYQVLRDEGLIERGASASLRRPPPPCSRRHCDDPHHRPSDDVAHVARSRPRRGTTTLLALGVPALVLGLVLAMLTRWTVTVNREGLTVRAVLGRPRIRVPLEEVVVAEVVEVRPLADFGGWGLRTGSAGRVGVILRKGASLQVQRTGGAPSW